MATRKKRKTVGHRTVRRKTGTVRKTNPKKKAAIRRIKALTKSLVAQSKKL
jgi:hypothetical protein